MPSETTKRQDCNPTAWQGAACFSQSFTSSGAAIIGRISLATNWCWCSPTVSFIFITCLLILCESWRLNHNFKRLQNTDSSESTIADFITQSRTLSQLFTRGTIDSSLMQRVNTLGFTTFQNTTTLLTAVLGRIQADPRMFHEFLSALNEDPSMQSQVKSMQSKWIHE